MALTKSQKLELQEKAMVIHDRAMASNELDIALQALTFCADVWDTDLAIKVVQKGGKNA